MKPDYLSPERAAELIPQGRVKQALLCPHCNMVLYVGERPHKRGRRKPASGSRRGASRAKRPVPAPTPTPPDDGRPAPFDAE